jgi:hypothetical protein
MSRTSYIPILYQIFLPLWMLTLVSTGFVITWILICLQEPREARRPAFNLKEL